MSLPLKLSLYRAQIQARAARALMRRRRTPRATPPTGNEHPNGPGLRTGTIRQEESARGSCGAKPHDASEGRTPGVWRGLKRPGQAKASSGAPAVDSGAKTRRYRKNGLSDEFTLQSFVTFYMAMAVKLLEKLGLRATNPFIELLPSEARRAFAQRQRQLF